MTKLAVVCIVAATVILLGNAYSTERQIRIHQMQTELLQAQSNYAAQVSSLTDSTAPAQIAQRAGALHLVVPTSVSQVAAVSLNTPLPPPKLSVPYHLTSRIYR